MINPRRNFRAMHRFVRSLSCFLGLAATLAFVGCGGPTSSAVSGKVTLGGQPVTKATVNFFNPTTGVAASAEIGADGAYKVTENLPPGSYKVSIVPLADVSRPPMPGEPAAPAASSPVPGRYQSDASSGLTADIKPGTTDGLNFALEP
jgi:hypothetical protein